MHKIQITIVALLIFAWPSLASCQSFVPGAMQEKVVLMTDRSVYITGEQVHFSATVLNDEDLIKPFKSQILYCEIITPDGDKITGSKFLVTNSLTDGCVDIPDNILTGTYYFRAYTKLMRNYGPGSYGYCQIRVVNPKRDEILAQDKNQNVPALQITPAPGIELKDRLLVSVNKTMYAPRDSVFLSLQPEHAEVSEIKSLCLSVIPEGVQSSALLVKSIIDQPLIKTDYYPETRGLSISGKLTKAASLVPVPDKKVNLSIIGDGRNFMASRTDSSGRFFFALPDYYGARDLFVCSEKTDSMNVKIWVDNDFCTLPLRLPSPVFSLTEHERQVVHNMALNMQLSSRFYTDTIPDTQNVTKEELAFYGKPSNIIYIDKYIQLPTLEEYFNELPSEVKVRKRKGQPRFDVLGSRGVSFYDPLVLVDWVAVDDPAKVLAVSPQNIERIEVVNEDYVKGGQTYGGIISIISRKGDFAGIDLPSTGIFINYRFLSENHCNAKFFDNVPTHPDSRNTILWEPNISFRNGHSEKFVFTAPDTPGRYNVVVEGITTKGELITHTSTFEVGR